MFLLKVCSKNKTNAFSSSGLLPYELFSFWGNKEIVHDKTGVVEKSSLLLDIYILYIFYMSLTLKGFINRILRK